MIKQATFAFLCVAASAVNLSDSKSIKASIENLQAISKASGTSLEGNEDFHDWIMEHSQQKMPSRLEHFWSKLHDKNMRRRLFYIYKWDTGRRNADREDFGLWLEELGDWYYDWAIENDPDLDVTKLPMNVTKDDIKELYDLRNASQADEKAAATKKKAPADKQDAVDEEPEVDEAIDEAIDDEIEPAAEDDVIP